MAGYRFTRRTTALALLTVALASSGLTACGSSTNTASQARSISPRQAAIRRAAIVEVFNCARRHGIHLPPPTEAGVNVAGVKGRRNEVAMSHCYHRALKKAQRLEKGAAASQTER